MAKPRAVIISDVHYNLATLPLADAAMRHAIETARTMSLPLIVAGDLHDSKGAMRAECVNAMLDTFDVDQPIFVLPGNHCRINEKGKPHALKFLERYVTLVESVKWLKEINAYLIPYESEASELQAILDTIPEGSTVIAHTGVQTAYMGHYTQDKSSLPKEAFADFRTISGHYHMAQDIKCGRPRKGAVGLFSYIGNPYTLNYGEANDGPKGYVILNDDGSLTRVPTNLRKHIVLDRTADNILDPTPTYKPGDLIKIKVSGLRSELEKLDRKEIGEKLFGHSNYILDLVFDKSVATATVEAAPVGDTMDALIDSSGESKERKDALKALWRNLV